MHSKAPSFAYLLFHLLLPCGNLQAGQAQELIWLASEYQGPQHAKSSELNVGGASFLLIASHLKDIRIKAVAVNNTRAFEILQQEPNACAGNKLLTKDRLKQFQPTSVPHTLYLGLHLYVHADDKQLASLTANKPVSMYQVLQLAANGSVGLVGGRSYGDDLDKILQEPRWSAKLWTRQASDMAPGVLQMLFSHRVAAVIEYPSVLNRYQQNAQIESNLLEFALTEAQQPGLGYILCNPSERGRLLAEQLSDAIKQASQQQSYFQIMSRWLPDHQKGRLLEYYNQQYGTQFKAD